MPTQANPFLTITDGITTVTFADGSGGVTNWGPQAAAWAPNVAPLRRSPLGGRGPYADVVEELTINVRDSGATAAAAMANLDTLMTLLDQAERWTRGEYVNAVVLRYAPQGSTIAATATPFQAVILGRAPDDASAMLGLPARWDQLGMIKELWNVKVRVFRTGQWLIGSVVDGTFASANSGNVVTCTLTATFGGAQPHSPLALSWGTFTTTNIPTLYPGYFIMTGNTPAVEKGIKVINAQDGGTGAPWTLVNESANNARGTNVLRYTPTGTTFVHKRIGPLSWTSARRLAMFATVRNNSGTTTWQIRGGYKWLNATTNSVALVTTATSLIDTSSTNPQVIYLGTLVIPNANYSDVFVEVAASAASGTLDIDAIVVVCLDDDTSVVIGHDGMDLNGVFGAGVTVFAEVRHRVIDAADYSAIRPEPFVGIRQNGATSGVALTYRGDARPRVGLTEINSMWLTTSGAKWRFSQAGGSLQTFTVTPEHYNGFLTPT